MGVWASAEGLRPRIAGQAGDRSHHGTEMRRRGYLGQLLAPVVAERLGHKLYMGWLEKTFVAVEVKVYAIQEFTRGALRRGGHRKLL
jgi:hypothetical protein